MAGYRKRLLCALALVGLGICGCQSTPRARHTPTEATPPPGNPAEKQSEAGQAPTRTPPPQPAPH